MSLSAAQTAEADIQGVPPTERSLVRAVVPTDLNELFETQTGHVQAQEEEEEEDQRQAQQGGSGSAEVEYAIPPRRAARSEPDWSESSPTDPEVEGRRSTQASREASAPSAEPGAREIPPKAAGAPVQQFKAAGQASGERVAPTAKAVAESPPKAEGQSGMRGFKHVGFGKTAPTFSYGPSTTKTSGQSSGAFGFDLGHTYGAGRGQEVHDPGPPKAMSPGEEYRSMKSGGSGFGKPFGKVSGRTGFGFGTAPAGARPSGRAAPAPRVEPEAEGHDVPTDVDAATYVEQERASVEYGSGPRSVHVSRSEVRDRTAVAFVGEGHERAAVPGYRMYPEPSGVGGIVFESGDVMRFMPQADGRPTLVRPDVFGWAPTLFEDTESGPLFAAQALTTTSIPPGTPNSVSRVVKDVCQLVFTYRATSSIKYEMRPDCFQVVHLNTGALTTMELSSRTSMSLDTFSLTCLCAIFGSGLSNYIATGNLVPRQATRSAQVVCMAVNAPAMTAQLVLGPSFAQYPDFLVLLARLAPLAGIGRIAVLGMQIPLPDDTIRSNGYLASLCLRFVKGMIETATAYNLGGRCELAFLRGLTDHVSFNGHNREGGFLRTLLRCGVYPASSGYVSAMTSGMYGNEGVISDTRMTREFVTRICLNCIVRIFYLAECAAPSAGGLEDVSSCDRHLLRASELKENGKPLLPFVCYRTSNTRNVLQAYGGLLPAVQYWANCLQGLVNGDRSNNESASAHTCFDLQEVANDLRHLRDDIICPFYMIEPYAIRTHDCRPAYFCPGFDSLRVCTAEIASNVRVADEYHRVSGMMYTLQFQATSLRAQGLCMIFSNRADCLSGHANGGIANFRVLGENRKYVLNSHSDKHGLRDLGGALWRFPDTPFVHPLNGLFGTTPCEVVFTNPGYSFYMGDVRTYNRIELSIDIGQYECGEMNDRVALSMRYSRYSLLAREVRELARYCMNEFDELLISDERPRVTTPAPAAAPVRVAGTDTFVNASSLRTDELAQATIGQRVAPDEGATMLQRIGDLLNASNLNNALAGTGELRELRIDENNTGVATDDTGVFIEGIALRCDCTVTHAAIRTCLMPGRMETDVSQQAQVLQRLSANLGMEVPAPIFDVLLPSRNPEMVEVVAALVNGTTVTRSVATFQILERGETTFGALRVRYLRLSCGEDCRVFTGGRGRVLFGALTAEFADSFDWTEDTPRRVVRLRNAGRLCLGAG